MKNLKASDLKKIFVKWSHGTLYNRLESLKIKGNPLYSIKNETTGNVLYNNNAIDILKAQYLKEFSDSTEEIDKIINNYLSIKSTIEASGNKKQFKDCKSLRIDNNDTFDNIDKTTNINNINDSYINENYVFKTFHNEIVNTLKKQVELLQEQLNNERVENEKKDKLILEFNTRLAESQRMLDQQQQLQLLDKKRIVELEENNSKPIYKKLLDVFKRKEAES